MGKNESGAKATELGDRKNARGYQDTGDDQVRFAADAYRVVVVAGTLLAILGAVATWFGLMQIALGAVAVGLLCLELARIASRVGPPSVEVDMLSVQDAMRNRHRATIVQRVQLIAVLATASPTSVAWAKAKAELDFLEADDRRG